MADDVQKVIWSLILLIYVVTSGNSHLRGWKAESIFIDIQNINQLLSVVLFFVHYLYMQRNDVPGHAFF